MAHDKLGTLLIIIGILILVGSIVIGASDQVTGMFAKDGQEVTCNVKVNAQAVAGTLEITGATCNNGGTCYHHEPLSIIGGLTGTDVKGELQLRQSGKVYDTLSVMQNRLLPAGNYAVKGCVPGIATQIQLKLFNSNGGVDYDKAYDIN